MNEEKLQLHLHRLLRLNKWRLNPLMPMEMQTEIQSPLNKAIINA
jgi:hypothetical protein